MNMANRDRLKGKKTLKVTNFLDEFEKDDVKKEVDIIDLFASFGVKLSKKGKNYIGQCPWHDDASPSLSVDKAQGLYNCFGCGESGDIFTLTEKMKGYGFKEALDYLKKWKPSAVYNKIEAPVKESAPLPVSPLMGDEKHDLGVSSEVTLSTIADYYHKKLYDNEKATDYLKKRGLVNVRNYARFKIGYADGSLLTIISNNQKKALQVPGILRDNGKEHFLNCLTFPILDEIGNTVGLYGRNIDDRAKVIHLYLKGKHRGIFNRKASKVYDEIILTEGILDALSLIELGFENVQSIYGTNGFTEEHHRLLKDDRVKTIIIAFDKDEAGVRASETLKEKLLPEGFAVKVISPPLTGADGSKAVLKDWNDYLVLEQSPDAIKELIQNAEIYQSKDREKGFSVTKDHLGYSFTMNDINYRVTGVKDIFISNLRVNVRAELKNDQSKEEPERYYDNLDLYSARSRSNYYNSLSQKFFIEPRRIEKDLIDILEYLEKERDKRLVSNTSIEQKIELTEEDRKLGMKFLTNPKMYDELIADMTTLGNVGEETNKLLVWLAAISRLLPKPLSIFIQSPPSTGKSFLLDTLLKLLPPESVEWITSISDQAFNYMDEDDFLDKIFILGEALHNDIVEGYIRQMQSENRIARRVTLKDPKSGIMKASKVEHIARLVFMMTSTAMKVNTENLSRCLVLKVDDSKKQTERVFEMFGYRSSYEGYLEEKHVIPEIVKKHHAAQRLLKKIRIFNPFEKHIKFPSTRAVMRRGYSQFLSLINSSCVARQMQKEPVEKCDHYTGEIEHMYECDFVDYDIARTLFIHGKLLQQDEDLSSSVIELYERIRKMVREKAKKEGLKSEEVTFIQSEVRAITHLSNETVKKYLRILVDYEYLQIVGGKRHGTRFCYRLREDKPIEDIDISSIIPTVEEIKKMMENDKKGNM